MQERCYESGSCAQIICAILGVHPSCFGPTSVQFKGEINDALPRKRHQQRHLEFCALYLLSRKSWVRVPPGAPLFWMALIRHYLREQMVTPIVCFCDRVPGGRTTDVFSLFFCL